MFPEPRKRSLVKKEMQVLQALVGADSDADLLLERHGITLKSEWWSNGPKLHPFWLNKNQIFRCWVKVTAMMSI